MYKYFLKPILDWILALISLIVLFPLFVVVGIAIRSDSKGPVFFLQNRIGKNGRVFRIIKFRSMIVDQPVFKSHKLYENDPRITRVGAFIRKTSIDELPQIINILKGEMSFIGPRPPVTSFPKKFEEYNDFELKRFKVKPGISGLAQIRCREIHDWDINIPIDVEYVTKQSFFFDAVLFMRSILAFTRTGNVYREENATPSANKSQSEK
jgi:undecaprenyl phosphate N,N'-diacetylbacillosamine 1-phosphate transferase